MKRYLLLISMLAAFVAESAAREVYRLNDDWTFYFRSENSADDARNITLPHTWNLDALAGNSEYQRTTGNYMRGGPPLWACSADFDPQIRQQPILTHPRDDGTEFLILILKLQIAGCFCLCLAPLCGGQSLRLARRRLGKTK